MTEQQNATIQNAVLNMRSWIAAGEVFLDQVIPTLEMLERDFEIPEDA